MGVDPGAFGARINPKILLIPLPTALGVVGRGIGEVEPSA